MPRIEPLPWDALSPETRARFAHSIAEGGSPPDKTASLILACAEHGHVPDDGDRHYNFPRHLLPGRLLEMLRIRSAQLGGCEPCMNARKVDSVTDDVAACLVSPSLQAGLSEHERRALEFLDLLAADHHSIDDAVYRGLAEVFTAGVARRPGASRGDMGGMA